MVTTIVRVKTLAWCATVMALCLSAACGASQKELDAERARVRALEGELAEARRRQQAVDARLDDLQAKNEELRNELRERERREEARKRQFCSMMAKFKQMIEGGELQVRIVRNRMVVELPEDILFPSGEAQLKKGGRNALAKVADVLGDIENRDFQVAGHTDNVPIDNDEFSSNWELSSQRAVNVVAFLTQQGMSADRLAATGYGETRPVGSNDTEEGRAENRRIEIVLVPNLEELPDLSSLDEESC